MCRRQMLFRRAGRNNARWLRSCCVCIPNFGSDGDCRSSNDAKTVRSCNGFDVDRSIVEVGEVFHARAKLSNNHEPSRDVQTFIGRCLDWCVYYSWKSSTDAICQHEGDIFARTATEAVEGG